MAEDQTLRLGLARSAHSVVDRLIKFGRKTSAALLIAAAIFAYLNQSMVPFIDIYPAYDGALVLGASLILIVAAMTVRRDFLGIGIGLSGFVLGTVWVGDAVDDAVKRAAKNDERCWHIEVDMLSATPSRDDLPEIYQALGCRPRTQILPGKPSRKSV